MPTRERPLTAKPMRRPWAGMPLPTLLNATAVGAEAQANFSNATALAQAAQANAVNATAVGQGALANHGNATAVGQGAQVGGEVATERDAGEA